MHSFDEAMRMIAERGPRFAVVGTIRPRECYVAYSNTAEGAERWMDTFEERGYYQRRVHPPKGSIDLTKLGKARQDARRAEREATEILKAGVLRAHEEGRSDSEIARQAQVDRMTVLEWLGKRPSKKS